MKCKFFIFSLALTSSLTLCAQSAFEYETHWNYYFSFGAGPSILHDFNSDVYQDGHSNVQFGLLVERSLNQHISILSGVELERMSYAFDGVLIGGEDAPLRVAPAPDGLKYAGITRNNLALPLQIRYYFKPNFDRDVPNIYLQGGVRFGLNGGSEFNYREGGESHSVDIANYTNNRILSGELMIGFKGAYFENFDLLNASSFGVIYQFTPLFAQSDQNTVHPIHLTWRFLF